MFGALAAIFPVVFSGNAFQISTRSGVARFVALAFFAPWILVLEIGFLVIAYIGCDCVPEPSTLFVSGGWTWSRWLHSDWLTRAIPLFLVALTYFRTVFAWRWTACTIAACIFVPVGLNVSVLWSALYIILID